MQRITRILERWLTYFEVWQEVWQSLLRNKLRTTLTGLAVTVGMFLLVFLMGASSGVLNALELQMGRTPMNVLTLTPGSTSKEHQGLGIGRDISLDNRSLSISSEQVKAHERSRVASLSLSDVTLRHGKQGMAGTLKGIYPNAQEVEQHTLLLGRYINDRDLSEQRKVVLIWEGDAQELYGSIAQALHQWLHIDNGIYRIVGVLKKREGFGYNTSGQALIPFTTLQSIAGKTNRVEEVSLLTHDLHTAEENTAYEQRLHSLWAAVYNFASTDASALQISNGTTGANESNNALSMLRQAIFIVGLLTLLSGIVGISNIMLITVKERTREFGIRKALGARSMMILREVIIEGLVITLLFGYLGIVLGVAATAYLDHSAHQEAIELVAGTTMVVFHNPSVSLSTAMSALAVLTISGILAGYLPALKAVRIKPIEALKG